MYQFRMTLSGQGIRIIVQSPVHASRGVTDRCHDLPQPAMADQEPDNLVKLLRACGGCLGTRRRKGVEDCDMSGVAVKRALIPEFPSKPRELKHLITWRKRKKPRFR
jgi:hypothetical protein